MRRPKLFLAGHRKSGTTLLLGLLDGHPELCVYPQDPHTLYAYFPQFVREGIPREDRLARLDRVIFDQLKLKWSAQGWLDRLDIEGMRSRFHQLIEGKDLGDIGEVLEAQVRAFAHVAGQDDARRAWDVVKETSIEIYANELMNAFPGSRFIHLVRDPRDNYAALKAGLEKYYSRYSDEANTILASMIHRCGLGMKLASMNRERLGESSYLILRHEDVTSDPETEMKRIAEFAGIDYLPGMLIPTVLGHSTRGNNFEKMDMSKVRSVNVGRWRERITADEEKILEFHFTDLMKQYGYECEYTAREQMDAASEFYKWSNYRYFYFDHFAQPVRSLAVEEK
ncbi:MAG: sulfotransferase [bacterium]